MLLPKIVRKMGLALNELFEAAERLVPLSGDVIDAGASSLQRLGFEGPHGLPAGTRAVRQALFRQHLQMLCHCLTGDAPAGRQVRNGHRPASAQSRYQPQPCLVAECREDRRHAFPLARR